MTKKVLFMASVNRPTSPHLTIYKPQITSVLSIMHRITGIALYAGALVLVGWLALLAYAPQDYAKWHECATSLVPQLFFVGWTAAFFYHLSNGIRHLFWDMGKGFDLKCVNRSGWFVLLLTLALTGATWAFICSVWKI